MSDRDAGIPQRAPTGAAEAGAMAAAGLSQYVQRLGDSTKPAPAANDGQAIGAAALAGAAAGLIGAGAAAAGRAMQGRGDGTVHPPTPTAPSDINGKDGPLSNDLPKHRPVPNDSHENFDKNRITKNFKDWELFDANKEGITKLITGDKLVRAGGTEVLITPNGGVVTVTKDGTIEVDSKEPVKISTRDKVTTLTYPNGDSIEVKDGAISRVSRNGNVSESASKLKLLPDRPGFDQGPRREQPQPFPLPFPDRYPQEVPPPDRQQPKPQQKVIPPFDLRELDKKPKQPMPNSLDFNVKE